MSDVIDTHAHLNDPRLLRHVEPVLQRARAAGVTDIIVVGYDLESSQTALRLAQKHAGLWATVGIHPHHADRVTAESLQELRRLARQPRVVAIGEIGLDFFRDLSPRPAQRDAFRRQLDLAAELRLPAVLHCRDAQEEMLSILSDCAHLHLNWHCFDGTTEHAAQAVALGMHLGFGGMITYAKAEELRRALVETPLDRVLLETDSPYLAPKPKRRQDNEPAEVIVIGEYAARLRGEDPAALFAAATGNARRLFGLAEAVTAEPEHEAGSRS